MKLSILSVLLSASVLFSETDAGVLWLSQIPPPERAKEVKPNGMHRLPSLKKRGRGPATLALWLRQGDSILEAEYPIDTGLDSLKTVVLSPSAQEIEYKLAKVDGGLEFTVKGAEEGFYNAYLLGYELDDETLLISTIQAELINHSCRNGHKHVSRSLGPFYGGDSIPLEIVRTRVRWEDFHTFIQSGDVIEYQILLYGQAIPGVKVTMTTHYGWQKSQISDADGKVAFEFIGEYFGKDKEFHSRDQYHYLLVADYSVTKSGSYLDQPYETIRYQATVSEKYRPATEIYTSTVWALIIMLVTIMVIGISIFIYRRKTSHDYREIVFSEKD